MLRVLVNIKVLIHVNYDNLYYVKIWDILNT